MKKLVVGILAHVDAGKTTLSESMLYLSGVIKEIGRVDNQNAFLDTYALEKERGITIFSKQAVMPFDELEVMLVDTPGHVDFSAEMERTLQILDYAILVIAAGDGIQGHTLTLWKLLESYKVPVFIFINKTDQSGFDGHLVMSEIKKKLSDTCISFETQASTAFFESVALSSEVLMNAYLENDVIERELIKEAIKARKIFPCFFGSALKMVGIKSFLEGLVKFTLVPSYPDTFSAQVFKITRDNQGNRLTHLKVTGGTLKVKDVIVSENWEEKINQIRVYSGKKYDVFTEVTAGTICAVTGLQSSKVGDGFGSDIETYQPYLKPVLSYQLILPSDINPRMILPKLSLLEEEEPALRFFWHEALQEIQVQMMGAVQIEVIQKIIKERFDVDVSFGEGTILYKETIESTVEGVGHFEPLRHYAEVHLLIEPLGRNQGLIFESNCSEEVLAKNWQRLVLSHLKEKAHKGVLTGSEITDLRITLVTGRGHIKHTEGGDFREATFRALRQGLKEAVSILLEPYYHFELVVPEQLVGKAMMDIEKMHGTFEIKESADGTATLEGHAPVATMRNYHQEVRAYTKGHGLFFASFSGYDRCHNSEEVIQQRAYDSERDVENPTGSIFCAQGAGYHVAWDKVKEQMHVPAYLKEAAKTATQNEERLSSAPGNSISLEEIDQILSKTYYANQGKKTIWKKPKKVSQSYADVHPVFHQSNRGLEPYLLVDGYNIIFAWPELKDLASENLESARSKLLDILSNYQGHVQQKIMVVFDAYRIKNRKEEMTTYHNIQVVFTGEAQTADHYIEKFAHQNQGDYRITVATSDGLQQMIIRGSGCELLSARELKNEIDLQNENFRKRDGLLSEKGSKQIEDILSPEDRQKIDDFKGGNS